MGTGQGWVQDRDGYRTGMGTGQGWVQDRDGYRTEIGTGQGYVQDRDRYRTGIGTGQGWQGELHFFCGEIGVKFLTALFGMHGISMFHKP